MDNASLKSERFFNGPDALELLREIHQFLLYRKYSACVKRWLKSSCSSSPPLDTDLFISIMFELRCTKFRIVYKTMVDPLKMPLDASLSQIMGNKMISLCCSFPVSAYLVGMLENFLLVTQLLELLLNPNLSSFIQSSFKEIFEGSRGDAKTFSYMTSPVSIRTTFGIQ